MIVMKFGGSSLESAAAVERVAGIVRRALARKPVVVVSAMGKTTQQLLTMGEEAVAGGPGENRSLERLRALREMHEREIGALLPASSQGEFRRTLDCHFREMADLRGQLAALSEFAPESVDALSSYGERLSSCLIALVFPHFGINAAHVDARCVVLTDARHKVATPLYSQTYARARDKILPLVSQSKVPVLGGFIGATESGVTTTLGRGGSDFSAAIIGAGIAAEEIQIWTDVDGVMTCDPKLVPDARRVKTISFAEAAELAYFGAKVLHPSTLLPAMEKNIPVVVLNSRRPDVSGTRIVAESVPCSSVIKAISCKRGIHIVNIRSTRMLMAHGFLHRIFEIFSRAETAVDMLASSEVSVSLTVDDPARLGDICQALREFSEVSVEKHQAIVCIVGDNLRHTPGVAARAFGALQGINIRMISQGASLLNLGFVVAARDAEKTVKLLHQEFFRSADPAVFD
ncbi:MAG: lysine-sensitive aspartokinase 3 [Acidobacteria bacterium]|nr:MAG: lysine-sensitive aspartokinase 3 [Acidobacteriota bacterium]